jgi:hypothetical protein
VRQERIWISDFGDFGDFGDRLQRGANSLVYGAP